MTIVACGPKRRATCSMAQTAVPPDKAGAYSGSENVATIAHFAGGEADFPAPSPLATSLAPDQATVARARDALRALEAAVRT